MRSLRRRVLYYGLGLVAVMLGFAVLYRHGMRVYEDDPVSFLHALQVVVETFTTTGYGSDSPWSSAVMNTVVIIMDLTGILLIFAALPVLVVPFVEELLATSVPRSINTDRSDHVIICTYNARADALIDELSSWDVDAVLVEPDRDRATELYEADYDVIHADPESAEGLKAANISRARALVADVTDQVDTSIVLAAREVTEDVRIVSVVEEPDRRTYHHLAGADAVLSPRPLLGRSLASKVTTAVPSELYELSDDFEIAELPVRRDSRLVGSTLAQSDVRERAGVTVIGAWFQGEFHTPPDPTTTITSGTVLLVTGQAEQIQRLRDLTRAEVRQFDEGETIVIGYGQVGQTIAATLDDAGVEHTVIDLSDTDGVDVVGDATDPETLRQAGIEDASSVILALPDDTATEYATLVVRDMSKGTEVIARVEEADSIRKMYRAGADYVLSLATVSGRMIASRVLEEADVLLSDYQIEVVRTRTPGLVGQTLGEAAVRTETDCTVVAVERDGETLADVGPDFEVRSGDELIVAGTDSGVTAFREAYC